LICNGLRIKYVNSFFIQNSAEIVYYNIKFDFPNFSKCYFLYVTIFDLIILSLYFPIFHFNKYPFQGADVIHTVSNSTVKHLNLSCCLDIITIKSNSQLFVGESLLHLHQLDQHINEWDIDDDSFLIIYIDTNNNNLQTLFLLMDILSYHKIPRVYISSNTTKI